MDGYYGLSRVFSEGICYTLDVFRSKIDGTKVILEVSMFVYMDSSIFIQCLLFKSYLFLKAENLNTHNML